MTSVATARELGIPRDKWVFLHGCADAHDHWYVSERVEPAFVAGHPRRVARRRWPWPARRWPTSTSSTCTAASRRPCRSAARRLGLAEDDPRGLTITGGLPYFGGPGNNYVTHSISEMLRRLRARPGAFGLVTANGNYVTKHSFGVYSTAAPAGPWRRESPAVLQARMDALPKAPFTETPQGEATIETYTVMHGQRRPGVRGGLRPAERHRPALHRQPAGRPGGAVGSAESRQPRPAGAACSARLDGRNIFTPD